jgi:hypothetical protein
MRSYPLYRTGSVFSQLIDRAPAGEPQRVTWHHEEAVVVASEAGWLARRKCSLILSELFPKTTGEIELADAIRDRLWVTGKRLLSGDFADRTPMFLFDTRIMLLLDTGCLFRIDYEQ